MSTTELDSRADGGYSGVGIDASSSRRSGFILVTCLVCLLSLLIFFREFLDSGLNLVAGNIGDHRFLIALLEHWRAVAHGQASFRSPNFFWPERGVLGYSDALFLLSLPYIVGRAIGMDHFIAFELTLILLKAVGFFSMLWLLRSFVGVSRSAALVGSVLFTFSNLNFISVAQHGQLATVVFVPLLAALGCAAWRSYGRGEKNLGYAYSGSFGLLLALLLFTSFYIGWFVLFAGGVAIVSAFLASKFRLLTAPLLRKCIRSIADRRWIFAMAALAFSIAIIPFLMTYMPMRKQIGPDFQEVLSYSSHPIDLINIGQGNWMWGHLLNAVMVRLSHRPMVPTEYQLGWPPFTLGLIATSVVLCLAGQRTLGGSPWLHTTGSLPGEKRFLAAVLSASFIICWVLSLNVDGRSLWWLVFKFVPAGSAIRIPARLNLVLNVFVVVIASLVLNGCKRQGRRSWGIVFWVVSLLLIAEQINTVPSHLIRRDSESALLTRVHRPPSSCAYFFLAHPATSERPFYANQIDAMLIARMKNLPTINGYSSWLPPGWNFLMFGTDYLQNVRGWVREKGITEGLCGLDLRDGSWTSVDFRAPMSHPGSAINFHRNASAEVYETGGWGKEGEGGS